MSHPLGMLKRNRLLVYSELICIKGENGLCLLLTQGINVTDECSERGYQIAKVIRPITGLKVHAKSMQRGFHIGWMNRRYVCL